MVCKSINKASGLLIAAIIMALSFINTPDWYNVGIAKNCHLLQRLAFSFFHASALHAGINAWCLLSIIFIYDSSWRRLLAAYIIAVVSPDFALSLTPTVGLSAVCFALLGSIAFQVKRKLYYNTSMALYITLGFIFPLINGWLHLYSYVAGLFVGFLTMPIQCRKR